jgi:hypothetical protein
MEKQIEGFNYLITTDGQVISMYYDKPICQWIDNTGYLLNLRKMENGIIEGYIG